MARFLPVTTALAILSLSVATSHAAMLSPNYGLSNGGGATALPTGKPVETNSPFATLDVNGELTIDVYNEGAANPLGGLTFVYLITNESSSSDSLSRMTLTGYAGFLVNVGIVAPLDAITPNEVDRSKGTGNKIGYNFDTFGDNTLDAGLDSAYLVIRTNAPRYAPIGTASFIDGSVTTIAVIAPSTSGNFVPEVEVPEPASLGLLGAGILLLLQRRRRCPVG